MASKEIIKENHVPATLFVGLGGIGSEVVKRVAEKCRGSETDNVNFVVFDTNVNDLANITKSGKKIYAVQTSNTQSVGDYLDYDEDALRNWFPKNAVLYDKTVSEGAGQVRAISRLAFNSTIKTGKLRPLFHAIDDLFRKDGKEMKQALRIVIVSTAAGGTGSGIVLPMSMFLRDYITSKYPSTAVIIRGLLMLPEILDSVIKTEVERESLRRNAYATVKELNAFMMKGSGFFDIDGDLRRYSGLHVDVTVTATDELKSLALLPLDFCFLFDGQNAEDSTMASPEQYKEQAAQALYEQNIGPMQQKAFSVEDNIIKEISNKGNYGRNRFGGIGAGVLRYPYEDVADYIAYQWAIDRIGGEGEAAKWSKYDKAFFVKAREERKAGIPYSEQQTRGEVYTRTLKTASDNFSKDLRNMYLQDAERRITDFFRTLAEEMHRSLNDDPAIRVSRGSAMRFASEMDYSIETGSQNRGQADANLNLLRAYEMAVRNNAKKISQSVAEGIFRNETKTINEKRSFTIEQLIRSSINGICHPNAVRYLLYTITEQMKQKIKSTEDRIANEATPALDSWAPSANDAGTFDVRYTKKSNEKNIDEFCQAEVAYAKGGSGDTPSKLDKIRGGEDIYAQLNQLFPAYFGDISLFGELTSELEAYKIGLEYLKEVNEMFEKFFDTFAEKVAKLLRMQDDLVASIRFHKGDSVYNICADENILQELARTSTNGEEGLMLPSELCGQIFDAVKFNVAFDRETRNADVVEDDKRIDIFDDILLGYFQQAVRQNCDMIDVNVIEAIALEYRLKKRVQQREAQGNEGKVYDKVTHEDTVRYISEMLAMGERLSAPSIQRMRNVEPREVNLQAYNESLRAMRNYKMADLLPNGMSVNTISKYEVHFFNALYNLTPDKLSKFAAPVCCETGDKEGGLYHMAYHRYSQNIGPDSAKSMSISTHIDQRWDSIAVMPELDFRYAKQMTTRIHQALIYGLLMGAIQYREISQIANRKVYRYENSGERIMDLVVSNGTPCDQFYEVLDALYINPAAVKDVMRIKEHKRQKDKVRNANYDQTAFYRSLEEFYLPQFHEGKTSLFEIPLAYYATVPNTKRYSVEIVDLVDSIIGVFVEELSLWENETDRPFRLCEILKEQFTMLVDSFKNCESLRNNTTLHNNLVIDVVYRKIKSILEREEPVGYDEYIDEMKKLLR